MEFEPRESQLRYLLCIDFDNTLFLTSSPSSNDITVERAYELALDKIFGFGGSDMVGFLGLQDQTPTGFVSRLLKKGRDHYIGRARDIYEKSLEGKSVKYLPECPDGIIQWDEENPERTLVQLLVEHKLQFLIPEIGLKDENNQIWPPPCNGVPEFLEIVKQLKKQGYPIDLAVISSGHHSFIQRTFDMHGFDQPDILITEDSVRNRRYPEENERRFKPGLFPLALAHQEWLHKQGLCLSKDDVLGDIKRSKERMVFIDDNHDAAVAAVLKGKVESRIYPDTSWESVTKSLIENKNLLQGGRPISEILPPLPGLIPAEI